MGDVHKAQGIAGQDPKHTQQHQAPGSAEKAADNRIGNESDCAAKPRQTEAAKEKPGQRGAQRQHRQSGRQQAPVAAICFKSRGERGNERGNHRAGRAVRSADREWQRAAQRRHRPADRAGNERRRETVGKPGRQRPGENQCRVGHVEQDGKDPDDGTGDDRVRQRSIQSPAHQANDCSGLIGRVVHAVSDLDVIRDGADGWPLVPYYCRHRLHPEAPEESELPRIDGNIE